MLSPFRYSDTNKRYHTYDYHLRMTYGTKCARIPLDAGFSCPNRENGQSGCIYCSARGSGDFCDASPSLAKQFTSAYEALTEKWGKALPAIPYFQAYSSTYAPPEVLYERYMQIFSFQRANGEEVPLAACSIATRPDCLSDEVMAVLGALAKKIPLTVELGLQSMHDDTLLAIGRGHDFAAFCEGYRRLKASGISVCVHIINGLQNESQEMMLDTAKALAKLRPDEIKIHMLHVLRGTALGDMYEKEPFALLSMEEYVETVCMQLAYLPPETVVARLTGDGAAKDLIAPMWTRAKRAVIAGIDRYLASHNMVQGMYFAQ